MSNDMKEQVSALLDGELPVDAVADTLGRIHQMDGLRDTWDRYHLIGDALRGEGVRLSGSGVAGRVRQRIGAEPAIIATPAAAGAVAGSSVGERWRRPMVGAAIAASVAALAVVTLPELTDSGIGQGGPVQVAQAPVPVSGGPQTGTRWKNLTASEVESKLNQYLVNHNEYSTSTGMGMLPYTTFVSYDTGARRP